MSDRPRWLSPAAFVLLGLIWGSSSAWIKIEHMDARLLIGTVLVIAGVVVVGLRYDASVIRIAGGLRE